MDIKMQKTRKHIKAIGQWICTREESQRVMIKSFAKSNFKRKVFFKDRFKTEKLF